MRVYLYAIVIGFSLGLLVTSVAIAHSGGLDQQGGHNCKSGACKGTYHFHQKRPPKDEVPIIVHETNKHIQAETGNVITFIVKSDKSTSVLTDYIGR